jgi:hypothetical protein
MENNVHICRCGNPEHQMMISFDSEKSWNDLCFINIHLSRVGFFSRLKYAFKYVFGISTTDSGAFDEICLDHKQLNRLITELKTVHSKMEKIL